MGGGTASAAGQLLRGGPEHSGQNMPGTALVLLEWAWGRITAAPGGSAERWQAPAHALHTWMLPELDMRLAVARQRLADAAALQDKLASSA